MGFKLRLHMLRSIPLFFAFSVLAISAVVSVPAKANTLDFNFSFFDGNGAGQVQGTILGLADNSSSPATSVIVASANFGLGEYASSASQNDFLVTNASIVSPGYNVFLSTVGGYTLSLAVVSGVINGAIFAECPLGCPTDYAQVAFSPISSVPLPATLPLLAAGIGVLGYVGRRKKAAAL